MFIKLSEHQDTLHQNMSIGDKGMLSGDLMVTVKIYLIFLHWQHWKLMWNSVATTSMFTSVKFSSWLGLHFRKFENYSFCWKDLLECFSLTVNDDDDVEWCLFGCMSVVVCVCKREREKSFQEIIELCIFVVSC